MIHFGCGFNRSSLDNQKEGGDNSDKPVQKNLSWQRKHLEDVHAERWFRLETGGLVLPLHV